MTSETAEFVALPDGKVRATVSAGVVRVRRGSGWVPVDLTLVKAADGGVVASAHPGDLRVSGARPDGVHELAAVGVGARRVAMQWSGALPEPILDGNRATYVDVWPSVDLTVEATRTGFEQSLVVRDRAAAAWVAGIPLALTGPAVAGHRRDSSGGITLVDGAGVDLATVPAPAMWDAQRLPTGEPTRTAAIATTVTGTANSVELELWPDLGWLRDPDTRYPVTLDPTVNPVSTTFDTYVRETVTADRSGETDLQFGLYATTPPTIARSFLTWDTAAFVGKQINSATVHFFNFWSHTCTPQSWDIWTTGAASASTRWTSQPEWLYREAFSTHTHGSTDCEDAWASVSGTSFFQRAATGGVTRAHMGLRATDETVTAGFKQFRSRNWTNSAQLPYAVVTYNSWPAVTSRATVPATECVTGPGRPAVNTLTPQFKATVSDADGTAMSVTFEWWAVGGPAVIGSATVTGVASGGTATVTVPAGAFVDGGRYQWRVQASDGVAGSAVWSSFCEMSVYVTVPPVEGCEAGVDNDFDGDGVRDIVIGDPLATVDGQVEAGHVIVVYGGAGTVQTITENNARVQSTAETGDRFGHALAVYDVNRDGCADLVVGVPYEDVDGSADAGSVYVLLGAPGGLTTGPESLTWHQDQPGVAGAVEPGDWFGFSVAAGHTSTGEAYLVIGVPGEDIGTTADAGLVHYLRGTLNAAVEQVISPNSANEVDDRFGYSVAGSPYHIAVGHPGEAVGTAEFAGAVTVLSHELVSSKPMWVADLTGTAVQANANFGKSVAVVPYRPSGAAVGVPDSLLVVGVPGQDVGEVEDAGQVQQFLVAQSGVSEIATVHQGSPGVAGDNESGDYFGERVVAVNLDPAAEASPSTVQVAVGSPGEDLGVADAGEVRVFAGGTMAIVDTTVYRKAESLPGTPVELELLGAWLGTSQEYLLVSSPYVAHAVYAIRWTDLAAGLAVPAVTLQAGTGGLPADAVAFGAAVG